MHTCELGLVNVDSLSQLVATKYFDILLVIYRILDKSRSSGFLIVFSRSVDWNIVVNDGILMTWWVHSQHDSLLLRTGVFSLIHIIPAVRLDIFWQSSSFIFTQLLHWFAFHQHSVNRDGFLLWTIENIWSILIEYDGLSVD